MRNAVYYSILFSLLLCCLSCSKDEDIPSASYLSLSVKEVVLNSEASNVGFDISTDGNWIISGASDWLLIDQKVGSNNTHISISTLVNSTDSIRKKLLTIKAGSFSQELAISQSSQSYSVSDSVWRFAIDGGNKVLKIQYSGNWIFSGLPSWCTITQITGTGNASIVVTASNNLTGKTRQASLLLTLGSQTKKISITQTLADFIVETPGTLAELTNKRNIIPDKLIIEGTLNCNDFSTLRNISNLRILDIKNVRTVESSGFNRYGQTISCSPDGIPEYAFHLWTLQYLTLPDSLKFIGKYSISSLFLLKSLKIPANVIFIDDAAFRELKNIKSITIPSSLRKLGRFAFLGANELEEVIIEDGLEVIETACFKDIYYLESVILPNTLTKIEDDAFYGCHNLKSITLPSQLREIGSGAFAPSSLNEIHSKNTIPPVLNDNIFGAYFDFNQCTLYVPKGSKTLYKTAPYWSNFNSVIEE